MKHKDAQAVAHDGWLAGLPLAVRCRLCGWAYDGDAAAALDRQHEHRDTHGVRPKRRRGRVQAQPMPKGLLSVRRGAHGDDVVTSQGLTAADRREIAQRQIAERA